MDTCLQVQFSVVLHTEVVAPVVVVSSACTHGTFTFAGPFSSALGIGFTGTRGVVLLELIFVKGLRCMRVLL